MMPWSSPGIKPVASCVLTTTMPAAKPPTTAMVSVRRVTIRRRIAA